MTKRKGGENKWGRKMENSIKFKKKKKKERKKRKSRKPKNN